MYQIKDNTGGLRLQPDWYIHLDRLEISVPAEFSGRWKTHGNHIQRNIKLQLSRYGKPQKIGHCPVKDRVFSQRTSVRNEHVQLYMFTEPRPGRNVCAKIQISCISKDYNIYEQFLPALDHIFRKHRIPWQFYCAEISADTTSRHLWETTIRRIPDSAYYSPEKFWYWDSRQPAGQKQQPGFHIPQDRTTTGYHGYGGRDSESVKWYIRQRVSESLQRPFRLEWTGHGRVLEEMEIHTFGELIARKESILLAKVPELRSHPTPQDGTQCAHSSLTTPNADANTTPQPSQSTARGTQNASNSTQRILRTDCERTMSDKPISERNKSNVNDNIGNINSSCDSNSHSISNPDSKCTKDSEAITSLKASNDNSFHIDSVPSHSYANSHFNSISHSDCNTKQHTSSKSSIDNSSHVHSVHSNSHSSSPSHSSHSLLHHNIDNFSSLSPSNLDKDNIHDIASSNHFHLTKHRKPRISIFHRLPNGKSISALINKIKFNDFHYSVGRPRRGISPKGKSAQLIAQEFGISSRLVEYLRVILKDSNAEHLFMCGYPVTKVHSLLKSGQIQEIVAQEIRKTQLYLQQLPDEIRIPLGIDERPWIPFNSEMSDVLDASPHPFSFPTPTVISCGPGADQRRQHSGKSRKY